MWKMMKRRLGAVLLCLIVVCVCGCSDGDVPCAEEVPRVPGPSPQASGSPLESGSSLDDKEDTAQGADARSSYEVGLAAERQAALGEALLQDSSHKDQVVDSEEPATDDKTEKNSDPEGILVLGYDAAPEGAPVSADDVAEDGWDASGRLSSQALPATPASLSEGPPGDAPVAGLSDPEQPASDCEPGEPPLFDGGLPSLPVGHTENASSGHRMVRQTKADVGGLLGPADEQATGLDLSENTSHVMRDQGVDTPSGKEDPSIPGKDHGDIPTFDEWKKKMMEVEKEKSQSAHSSSSNGSPVVMKKVQNFNNYASVECGAKILAANTEAKSTSAILMENMDLYMLNPCSNKIWFVIELCEPIQVKQLDIANFELFSSTPKDFLVSISDRYPTNKWMKLGTFHAQDKRTVQSFPLDEQLYAKYVKTFIKYIKVELLSHFGSEHFCPLSLIRVFGTSMVEEYEEISESQFPSDRSEDLDEDYDFLPGYVPVDDKSSKNLIDSATDAILNMVNNLAVNVLGGNGAQDGNVSAEAVNVTEDSSVTETLLSLPPTSVPENETVHPDLPDTPEEPGPPVPEESPIVVLVEDEEDEEECDRVTVTAVAPDEEGEPLTSGGADPRQLESNALCKELSGISCRATFLEYLRLWCSVSLGRRRRRQGDIHTPPTQHLDRAVQLLPEEEATSTREEIPGQTEVPHGPTHMAETPALEPSQSPSPLLQGFIATTGTIGTSSVEMPMSSSEELLEKGAMSLRGGAEEQQESRTLDTSSEVSVSIRSFSEEPRADTEHGGTTTPTQVLPPETPLATEVPAPPGDPDGGQAVPGEAPKGADSAESPEPHQMLPDKQEESLEDLLSVTSSNGQVHRTATDFYAEQNFSDLANGNHVHGSNQKESVFMRLSNRIKALEMNMSLSGRYLEELSQRYKKQMDDMQKAFNTTIIKLQNTSKMAEEQDHKQTESIQLLQVQLHNITELLFNLSATVHSLQREASSRQTYLLLSLLLCISLGVLLCIQCCRVAAPPFPEPDGNGIYWSPKRCFSSYDDMSLLRKVPRPLVRSRSLQFSPVPADTEPLKRPPEHRKKKLHTTKVEGVETLRPSIPASALPNGAAHHSRLPRSFLRAPGAVDPTSEGSSEGSSHSEESYFCGISASACSRLCNGQPPARGRPERRGYRRRRSRLADTLATPPGAQRGGLAGFRVPALSGPV
nr:SUN domain-containing ossification factor-like isoform X3 [Paramormyrops kingsleyae]